MAANYWESKWAQSVASKNRLLETQLDDRLRGLTEEQIQQIKVHFVASIHDCVKQYKSAYKVELRQRVAATASIYFRRFYLKNCFCHVDPRLVFVGCVYLASKVEESQLQAKHLVAFVRKYRPQWNYEMKHLLDMEMVLMEDLNFNLVVFSPYRSLAYFLRDLSPGDEVGLRAWSILNDSYKTDVSLLHAPHVVALACIQLAVAHAAAAATAPFATASHQQQGQQGQQGQGQQQQGQGQQQGGVGGGGAAATAAGGSGGPTMAPGATGIASTPTPPSAPTPSYLPTPGGLASQALPLPQAEQVADRLADWMAGLNTDLDEVCDAALDITDMYERHLCPISVEECNRLLDAVQNAVPPLAPGGVSVGAMGMGGAPIMVARR